MVPYRGSALYDPPAMYERAGSPTVGAAFYAMDAFRTKLSITDAVAPTTLGNRRRYKFTSQRGIGCEER
jgi:hypothetical protein